MDTRDSDLLPSTASPTGTITAPRTREGPDEGASPDTVAHPRSRTHEDTRPKPTAVPAGTGGGLSA